MEPSAENMKKLFSSLYNKKKFEYHNITNNDKDYNVSFELASTIEINKFFTHFQII
jgi:hypothetical protein